MHLDVVQLRRFYYETRFGRVAQRNLQDALRAMWPDTRGMNVAGFGFAAPFLRPFFSDSARVICLMPAPQGACLWPPEGPNLSVLTEENLWPLPNGYVDRLILAHGLEHANRTDALLDEVWRVLSPEGRVIVIAPNRAAAWARGEATPFGFGRPYSFGQIEAALEDRRLQPLRRSAALYAPPSPAGLWLRASQRIEALGRKVEAHRLGGVLIVEAGKHVLARPGKGATARSKILSLTTPLAIPALRPAARRDG